MDSLLRQGLPLLDRISAELLSPSSIVLAGMVCVVAGLVYMAAAFHEIRGYRPLVETAVTAISVGLAFAITRGIGAKGGVTGAIVGLVFGLSLGLGLEFPIPSRSMEHTWFGKVQRGFELVVRFVVFSVGFMPYLILWLALGLVFLLFALPAAMLFFTIDVLGLLFGLLFYVIYAILKPFARTLAIITNWLTHRTLGTSDATETSTLFIFRHVLPSGKGLRWLLVAAGGVYVYALTLLLGHLASIVVVPLLPSALATSDEYVLAFAKAPAIGFLLGSIVLEANSLVWIVLPHHKNELAWRDIVGEMEWFADAVEDISALEDTTAIATAAKHLGKDLGHGIVDPNFVPNAANAHETEATDDQHRRSVARELMRNAVLVPFIGFAIGLFSGLGLGSPSMSSLRLTSVVHLVISNAPTLVQHAIIFLGAYLLNRIAVKFGTPLLAALGLLLFLLGVAFQLLQFGPVTDLLLKLPFQ